MPVIASRIDKEGALFGVSVGVPPARAKMLRKLELPGPDPILLSAVLDTGTTFSGVDPRVLRKLELDGEVGSEQVYTPSTGEGPHLLPVYYVHFGLLVPGGPIDYVPLRILACSFGDDETVRAMIGRDILQRCRVVYDGPGASCELNL